MADQRVSGKLAAAVLARALGDAICPERPAHDAAIGDALLTPAVERALVLLELRGYRLVAA